MQKKIRRFHISSKYRAIRYCRAYKTILLTLVPLALLVLLAVFFDVTCTPRLYDPKLILRHQLESDKRVFSVSHDDEWTALVGPNILSIYSAFSLEQQTSVIGIINKNYIDLSLSCKFSPSSNQKNWKKTAAKLEILSESWKDYYSFVSIKIICQHTPFAGNRQVKISFNVSERTWETTLVPIHRIAIDENPSIVVCVRPLFGQLSATVQLLEFIAYYRANGVEKFIFYDLSSGGEIKDLLEQMPFVRLLPFRMPIDETSIHAQGQVAAMNDCLLRSARSVVVNVDIDELVVIVTKRYANIKEYVFDKIKNRTIGALVIPNVMLCDEFNPVSSFPRILTATVRQTSKWRHRDRSKVIILRPLSVNELGIHTVWSYSADEIVNENIDQEDAMLFHYRSCCRVWQPFYQGTYTGITLYFLAYNDITVRDASISHFETQIVDFLRQYVIL